MNTLTTLEVDMLQVQQEPFLVVEDNKDLIEQHWYEVVPATEHRVLDIAWETFRTLEKAGRLFTCVARDYGEVVGYTVFILQPHLHSQTDLGAHNDALFLHPRYRKGTAGLRLIKESERLLELAYPGCTVLWHVKQEPDFSALLLRLGHHKQETVYARKTKG